MDRKAAGGPARGVARVRRRRRAMRRAARCTDRACRRPASTSMRARAMRARSSRSSPSRCRRRPVSTCAPPAACKPGRHRHSTCPRSWDAFRWPLAGDALIASPRGSLQAQGWTEFSYRVNGDYAPAQGPPFSGEASGRFTTAALVIEESSWRVLGGRVTLAGSLGRGDSPAWTMGGRAAGIDPSRLRPALPGKLGFELFGIGHRLRGGRSLDREVPRPQRHVPRPAGARQRRDFARPGPGRVRRPRAVARARAPAGGRRRRSRRPPRRPLRLGRPLRDPARARRRGECDAGPAR